ncbi:hypothetical protein Lal_00026950 [Lupinus albus]|nr:hypothetical protein Lal_00026950 [Lupinus albus]
MFDYHFQLLKQQAKEEQFVEEEEEQKLIHKDMESRHHGGANATESYEDKAMEFRQEEKKKETEEDVLKVLSGISSNTRQLAKTFSCARSNIINT